MALLTNPLKSQNLVSQVSSIKITRPAGFYKSIVVDFLGVLTALLTSFAYREYLAGKVPLILTLTAVGVFMAASVFGALLMKSPARRGGVLLAETAALGTFFIFDAPIKTLVLLGAVIYCFLLWGDLATRTELGSNVEMKFFRITRPQFKKLTTALLLAGVVFYLPHWNPESSVFSKPNFDVVYTWAAGVANNFYPEIRFTSTVEHFAQSFAHMQLQADAKFRELPPPSQEQVFAQTVTQTIETLRQGLEIEVEVDESLADVAYRFITTIFDNWEQQFGSQFLLAWAVAAYLILRSAAVPFYLFVSFCCFVIYQLLLAANFIMVIGETKVQETIQYT